MAERIDAVALKAKLALVKRRLQLMWLVSLVVMVAPALVMSFIPTQTRLATHSVMTGLAAVLVVLFAVFLPGFSRDTPRAPRVTALVMGFVSVAGARWSLIPDSAVYDVDLWPSLRRWLIATALAFAALLIVAFLFEMGRKDRSRLIESLSGVVASGAAAWAAGGWVFLPDLLIGEHLRVSLAVIIVAGLSLTLCSAFSWSADLKKITSPTGQTVGLDTSIDPSDWAGLTSLGVLPIVLTGISVPLMLIAVIFIF